VPNENLSCASTGNNTPIGPVSVRKAVRIHAALFYDETQGATPVAQLEQLLQNTPADYDASFAVYTDGRAAIDLILHNPLPAQDAVPPQSGIEARVAKGVRALYGNIINVNAPERLIELLTIVTCGFVPAGSTAHELTPEILETECLRIRQQLEHAGYTVRNIQLRVAGIFESVAQYSASISGGMQHPGPAAKPEALPLERQKLLLRNE
jgi:hypothetical protein